MKRLACFLVLLPAWAYGQSAPDPLTAEAYIRPPKPILDAVLAPRHLNVSFSNPNRQRTWFCIGQSDGPPTLADVGRPYVTLGGLQFDPEASRTRSQSMRGNVGFLLLSPGGESRTIEAPKGFRVGPAVWSPSGKWFAFLAYGPSATYLWIADASTGLSKQVSRQPLLPTMAANLEWTADETAIYAVVAPDVRPARPDRNGTAAQPRVLVSEPTKNRVRPVRGLMETQGDQALLEYLITGQLARIDVASGKITPIGGPRMIRSFSIAPDGSAARIVTVLKPFSYIVGLSQFGSKEELVAPDGKTILEISNRPMRFSEPGAGGAPGGGGRTGGQSRPDERRDLKWRPDGKGLSYLMREPEPPKKEGESALAKRKEQLFHWSAPYGKDDAKVIYEQDDPIGSVQYSADCQTIFFSRTVAGASETVAVDLATKKAVVLASAKPDDFGNQPGSLHTGESPAGVACVVVGPDRSVFFRGTQYFKDPLTEAPRPFLDKVSLADGKKTRIWQSPADAYETIVALLDDEGKSLLVSRQSSTTVPDAFRVDVASKAALQLTRNRDYAPEVTKAKRFLVRVKRADGFQFNVKVTMPEWWVKGAAPLPAMFWFYPNEVVDQKAYDEAGRSLNKNLFPSAGANSMSLLVMLGYAFIEPDCPIVGPADRKNDSYIPDLRNNLSATIDALASQGFIDRSRLALGGHSYGAFSTVNAMVHTPFFKVGIAGDGAYNRMLTPMAFQAETRTLWEARETYLAMSPLLYAEQLTGALLLYHGMDDLNPGTHPINSERLFNALDGLGKTVSLYMYPYEDHSPAAIESILDLWARKIAWLERYLLAK